MDTDLNFQLIILGLHAIPFLIGLRRTPTEQTRTFKGLVALLFTGLLAGFIMLPDDIGTSMYLIFSFFSVGVLPLFTLTAAYQSGRYLTSKPALATA